MENPIVLIRKSDVTVFDTVDDVVGRSVAAGDPLIALEFIQGLQRDGMVKGLAIAKTLYRIRQSWDLFRVAGIDDDFEGVVETTTGYRPDTAHKYINMWESVFENPGIEDDLKVLLAGKPIETLLLLTAAAREGSFDEEDWKVVANSGTIKEVRAKIQEKRGLQTSANRKRYLTLYRKNSGEHAPGALVLFNDGEQKVVGYFNIESKDPDIDAEIEKIVNARNVYEVH